MLKYLYLIFLGLIVVSVTGFISDTRIDTTEHFNHSLKTHTLGISIVLYRVAKADKAEELMNLEKQMDKSKSINLYKITEDLGIILMNTADPYSDENTLPYKMLFGNFISKSVGDRNIFGFISTVEVGKICEWIKQNKIEHFENFSKIYENLSPDAKQALEDIGSEDKKDLFNGYVKPLTEFYFAALKDKNSIIICGE